MRASAVTSLALAALLAPVVLEAQQSTVEVIPHFTSYYATGKLFDLSEGASKLEAKQEAGPGLGARMMVRLTSALAVELDATYVRSAVVFDMSDSDPELDFGVSSVSGSLLFGTGRLVYTLPNTNLRVFGGGGMVNRMGRAFDGDDVSTVAPLGVAGVGVRAPITTTTWLDLVLEANVYAADPYDIESATHTDLMVKVGVPIMIGRRK